MEPLERLGFALAGYGCTTCIGNSGPLDAPVATGDRGERPGRGRGPLGQPQLRGADPSARRVSYLASPPLVVAFALAGSRRHRPDPRAARHDPTGRPVMLDELWPSADEIRATIDTAIDPELFRRTYASVFEGDDRWRALPIPSGDRYAWEPKSTYVARPPFFEGLDGRGLRRRRHRGRARAGRARGLGDDRPHLPGGHDRARVPAGQWLQAHGVGRSNSTATARAAGSTR